MPADFFQQDITGVEPLGPALQQALRAGKPARFWELLGRAAAALEAYADGLKPEVPLPAQVPASLALAPGGRIVLLDGELTVHGELPPDGPAAQLYKDADLPAVQCPAGEFGPRHARALRRFAEQCAQRAGVAAPGLAQAQAIKPLTLASLRGHCEAEARRGGAPPVAAVVPQAPPRALPRPAPVPVAELPKAKPAEPRPEPAAPRRGWLLTSMVLSWLLSAGLVCGVAWLLMQQSKGAPDRIKEIADRNQADDRTKGAATPAPEEYHTKSYFVFFPSSGSNLEPISAQLKAAFPTERRHELKAYRSKKVVRDLLDEHRAASQKELRSKAPAAEVLAKLAAKNVRFPGREVYKDRPLDGVYEQYGVFEYPLDEKPAAPAGRRKAYSSLLRDGALKLLVERGGLSAGDEASLVELRREIANYAALQDALGVTGERVALVVEVKRGDKGKEEALARLHGADGAPVFVGRTRMALTQVIDLEPGPDPSAGEYVIQLARACYFRQVSRDDRDEVDRDHVKELLKSDVLKPDTFRWRAFKKDQKIAWSRVDLRLVDRRNDAGAVVQRNRRRESTTFDLAVEGTEPEGGKVTVVFRNQRIFVASTLEAARASAFKYLTALGVEPEKFPNLVGTNPTPSGQFAAVLAYEQLADYFAAKADDPPPDIEKKSAEHMAEARKREDAELES